MRPLAASAARTCRTEQILARPSPGWSTTGMAAAACISKTLTVTCWRSSPGLTAAAANLHLVRSSQAEPPPTASPPICGYERLPF